MPDAVTVPSLVKMTSIASKESLARSTVTQTDRLGSSTLKFVVIYHCKQKSGLKKRFDMNQISFSISCDKAVS